MNDQSKIIDEDGREVLDPRKALSEQTLAVDLARVEIDQQIATAHKFPRSIDTVSMIQLITWVSVLMSGAGISRSGPIIGAMEKA